MIRHIKNQREIDLILASQSAGRKKILREMGIPFAIDPAHIDEESYDIKNPLTLVKTLAKAKATLIAKRHPNKLILAADTVVVKDEKIIGKPRDKDHAYRMLFELSAKTHFVFTGLALIDTETNKISVRHAKSAVTFNALTEEQIQKYLKTNEWLGKAGSYSSQEQGGKILIKQIDGDVSNVVGLPKTLFLKMLHGLGLEIAK